MRHSKMILIFISGTFFLTNCGSPEPPPPPPMNPVETVINKGIHEGMQELNEEMMDTASMLHESVDTLKDVLKENEKEINAGLNILKKVLYLAIGHLCTTACPFARFLPLPFGKGAVS